MDKKRTITPEIIGANIRRLRIVHGETQLQLAGFLGYGVSTVANYESGYRLPDLVTFFQIAFHYGASLEDFATEKDPWDEEEGVHDS